MPSAPPLDRTDFGYRVYQTLDTWRTRLNGVLRLFPLAFEEISATRNLTSGDLGKFLIRSSTTSSVTLPLPDEAADEKAVFRDGDILIISNNVGLGTLTVAPSGVTVNGSSSSWVIANLDTSVLYYAGGDTWYRRTLTT